MRRRRARQDAILRSIRVSPEQFDALTAIAARLQVPRSAVVRFAIQAYLDHHRPPRPQPPAVSEPIAEGG